MPRILFVAHSLPPDEHTGTPLTTHGYANAIAARGWDVTVLYASASARSWMTRPTQASGEAFSRIAVPRSMQGEHPDVQWSLGAAADSGGWSAAAAGFGRLLDTLAPQVLHVVNNVQLPLELPELAQQRGIPVVRSVTGNEDLCGLVIPVSPRSGPTGSCAPPLTPAKCAGCVVAARPNVADTFAPPGASAEERDATITALLARKRARVVHQFVRVFDRVVFPTASFRNFFEQSIALDPTRTEVVPMGMDLALWGGPAIAAQRAPRTRATDVPTVFAVVGTMDRAKGVSDAVDAFSSPVLAQRDDWRLRFVGGGDAGLVSPLSGHPQVELHGAFRADELPRILADVDVGISPSRFETFHRTTREYLLAGLPVIGTRACGIPEIVRDGENGFVVDCADPPALAAAVTSILDSAGVRARLTEGACRTHIRSIDDEADDLLEVYDRVVGATVPRR